MLFVVGRSSAELGTGFELNSKKPLQVDQGSGNTKGALVSLPKDTRRLDFRGWTINLIGGCNHLYITTYFLTLFWMIINLTIDFFIWQNTPPIIFFGNDGVHWRIIFEA